MLAPILAIWKLILPEFRLRFFAILGMAVLVALLETFGVASVMPLVAVLVAPDRVAQAPGVRQLLAMLGMGGAMPPVYVIGSITIALFVLANVAALAFSWFSLRFTAQLMTALALRLGTAHFRHPFTFFMTRPAAELANLTCNEVTKFALGGVLQLFVVLSRGVSAALVLVLLLAIAPAFTAVFVSIAALLYAVIYRYSARHIGSAGQEALAASGRAMSAATEMYGIAREILLRGDPAPFVRRVGAALADYYRADAVGRVLPSLPKYALEVASVCALFAIPIYRSILGEDARAELPLLATFAYAGFRILPLIQQLYASLTLLRYHLPLAAHLEEARALRPDPERAAWTLAAMPARIELSGIEYRYPGGTAPAIAGISLTLSRGERVAIVGASGAGKSTLLDILLGLLPPSAGTIAIDGAPGRLGWKAGAVGYVPQAPLILNASIARNIAFGLEEHEIDFARCREAAAKAEIVEVIDAHRRGYDAVIGSDVPNLSGGERQRLAIARALYSRPSLLVLDEPGSALDPPTSRKIFELLCSRQIEATVLVVTHEVEHLARFDRIVFLQKGRIVRSGSYDALVRDCPEFRRFEGRLVEQRERY